MAGLFDNVSGGGILDYIRSLDKATEPFMGGYWGAQPGANAGGVNLLDYLQDLDRRSGNPYIGGIVSAVAPPSQPGLNAPQSDDMGMMYGQPPAPQAQQAQQALPPSIASAPMSPQMAQQAFDLPTGSYAFGGQMVPTFGQPQSEPQISARRRDVQPPAPPVVSAPSIANVQPAPAQQSNPIMDFLSAIKPGFVDRYDAKKSQEQAAKNLSGFFQAQGMDPKRAAYMGAIAAQNPDVMKSLLAPPKGMEESLVSPVYGGGGAGGDQTKAYLDYIRGKNAAEKAGTVQGESMAQGQIDLPSTVATAQEQLRLLGELKAHPGRGQVGWHDPLGKAPLIPSTKGYDANNVLEQVKSGAFMTAFNSLKGGGQITEKEGQAATAAINRMDRATSKPEFDKALSDYEGILRLGIDRASSKAGLPAPYKFEGNQGWTSLPGGVRIRQVR